MALQKKEKLLAKYEIGWWKWHGRKDLRKAASYMVKEYQLQFGLSYNDANAAVSYRIKAARMHDKAEELERRNKNSAAKKYWEAAEKFLEQHFKLIK